MPDAALPAIGLLLSAIRAVVGDRGLLTDPADTAAYSEDWRRLYQGRTRAVVRPATTQETAAVVRLCAEAGVPIVPQGGNTSMVGGAVPAEDGSELVLEHRPAEPCPRDRPGGPDDDHRGRCHAESRADSPPPTPAACCRCRFRRRARRRSAACSAPTPAATTPCATATRATWCSGWKSCWPTARSGTACAGCARTTPATACASCSWGPRARSASSPPPC